MVKTHDRPPPRLQQQQMQQGPRVKGCDVRKVPGDFQAKVLEQGHDPGNG